MMRGEWTDPIRQVTLDSASKQDSEEAETHNAVVDFYISEQAILNKYF